VTAVFGKSGGVKQDRTYEDYGTLVGNGFFNIGV